MTVVNPTPVDAPGRERQDAYAVSAEFYDVLQAERDEARVRALYRDDVRGARVGVLDVGAGTGRVTLMSLLESRAPVHAVEPARSMRTPLMTRLASLSPELTKRVTVHPQLLEEAGLYGVADVAVCHNTVACLHPESRRALWPAVAEALVPAGVLLVQLPPARLPRHRTTLVLPTRTVGRHEYGGRMVTSADVDRIRTRFDYWVREDGRVLRRHDETFWMWPLSRPEMIAELRKEGFIALPERPDPSVLALRLA
ncbi:class I SAM-dependent methyltransferase [Streptomyces sp. WM6386]|uniref:class I SAM-dependent methyltransferase n=1 Tax=Streptomyces sp. WM6386 TaxID=1415558 RepID=UPI000A479E0D|nr:class I SAM-dependent methyltransferase [Streptomyces sp. WM6386]